MRFHKKFRFKGAGRPGSGNRTRLVAAIVKPFSVLALVSLIVLAITGILAVTREFNFVTTLFTAWYGQALMIEVALVVFTILLGAGLWIWVKPRLLAFAQNSNSVRKGAGSFATGRTIFKLAINYRCRISS